MMPMNKIRINEEYEQSCREIYSFIEATDDINLKTLMFQDIATKLEKVRPEVRLYYLSKILLNNDVNSIIKERFMDVFPKKPSVKPRFDIAIVTITPPEFTAVKIAFDILPNEEYDRNDKGYRFWEFGFANKDGVNLKAVVTMVGDQGTKACISACDKLFSLYSIDLCILIGIAAGRKEKFSLGDTISPNLVIDYENQRLEPQGARPQPEPFKIDHQLKRDLSFFSERNTDWQAKTKDLIRINHLFKNKTEKINSFGPKFDCKCVLFTGAKLIADGEKLDELRETYHEKGKAADKEGSGFASACEDASIKWLIFKAISDYGDENKPESDDFQTPYSLSAAVAARYFLEQIYELPKLEEV